jgi:hypothetical protein
VSVFPHQHHATTTDMFLVVKKIATNVMNVKTATSHLRTKRYVRRIKIADVIKDSRSRSRNVFHARQD